MRTISGLRKAGHSLVRSVMSSLFRFAAVTTARSIDAGLKPPGGRVPVSIRPSQLARFGSKATRYQLARKNRRRTLSRYASRNCSSHRILRVTSWDVGEYRYI